MFLFLKSMQKDERRCEVLNKWELLLLLMKHKSGHTISTRDFNDKLTSDLNSPSYLALRNKVMSSSKCFHTSW